MDVEVRQTTALKGKGLFVKRKFEKGAVLFEEDPLVSCQFSWNAACHYKACSHCLRPLETAEENASRLSGQEIVLPYPQCCSTNKSEIVSCMACGESYCSEQCRNEAFQLYHKVLCLQTLERNNVHPLEILNEAWKNCHYPPETNTIMLMIRLLARIVQADDKNEAVRQVLQFCHRTVNEEADLAHKLLGEKFAPQLSMLYEFYVNAIPQDEVIKPFSTLEGFKSLLALIGTNGQGIATSPLSQWYKNISHLNLPENETDKLDKFVNNLYDQIYEKSDNFLDNEGVGLYALQSSCNHSCSPNAEPSFLHNSHRLSLVALKDIEEGEEVFISYLDECFLNRSRHSRQKELMNNYLFVCNCPKCEMQTGDDDVTSDDEDEEDDEDMNE